MADRAPVAGAARPRPGTGAVRNAADRALAVRDQAINGQLAGTAGGAVVTAARMGRLFGRVGWRIARQLPGMAAVEQQGHRLREAAAAELIRLLELPQQILGGPEDQRVMMLVRNATTDPTPLRTAMSELLHRSTEADRTSSREYLFGTIVSQLVPDEARILAALSGGRRFAVVDVLTKQVSRSHSRTVLANASTVGAAARVSLPDNVPTYLSRLHSFGLIEFSPGIDGLDGQFAALNDDPAVRAAKAKADGKFGSVKVARKSVLLSELGREFWSAAAPAPGDLDRLSS